jgi:hypothetical protein
MKYSKPVIVALASAEEVIQATMKFGSVWRDDPTYLTVNAYEADE